MKSNSFERVLQERLLENSGTEETNTPPPKDVNVVVALQSLTAEGATNDVARSVLQGEGDDTNNIARAAK